MDNKQLNKATENVQIKDTQGEDNSAIIINSSAAVEGTYSFSQGILGFEELKEYKLTLEDDGLLAHLTSVEDESVGFILMRPNNFFGNYLSQVDLDDENIKTLEASAHTIVEVWLILTLNHQEMNKTTANLRAPILLNPDKKIGAQIILHDEKYSTKQPLFDQKELDSKEKGAAG